LYNLTPDFNMLVTNGKLQLDGRFINDMASKTDLKIAEAVRQAQDYCIKNNFTLVIEQAPMFSFFKKNTDKPYAAVTINQVHEQIVSSRYKGKCLELAAVSQKEKQVWKRQNFDHVTFSGVFTYRNAQSLIAHSGYICLDFDKLSDPVKFKEKVTALDFVELAFISPSQSGVKVVCHFDPDRGSHLKAFNALSNFFIKSFSQTPDISGKDVPRSCFMSHDPEAFINPKYL
jgi:hypothetical protein